MARIALITGATAGIGETTALTLAKNGFDMIITGRRADRLQKLAAEIEKYEVRCMQLCFDVTDRAAVEKHLMGLPDEWKKIDVLINNAGLALGKSSIHEGDPSDWDMMIDTNIKGVLYVTHAVAPGMIQRTHGHIVNLGSIAGKEVYKGGAVYNATKFAVEALSKAMRIDFLPYNIRVTNMCPGNTETEFSIVRFKGDTQRAKEVYEGFTPLHAEDIADAILWVITRPTHVCINDMLVMPTAQANTVHLHKQA